MRRHWMPLIAVALIGLGGTALAQTLPALTAGGPPATGQIQADPSMTLTIAAPQEVIIDAMTSDPTRDAQVRLMHDGAFVAEDSDSGEGTNARLAWFVAPGTYQVVVYEYQYRAMTATVQVTAAPAFTAVATVAPGAPATAITTPEGDWARAASVEVGLTVATPGNYLLTATPGDAQCSPEITVIHDTAVDGYAISGTGSGTPATATRALVAGGYTLRIRNWWGHTCPMTLTVVAAP